MRGSLSATAPATGELFDDVALVGETRVEHIVSSARPDSSPQVQGWDEWVLVLAGSARLDVAGAAVELGAGEWVLLPAGTPHRVLRTDAGTQWLAVHGPG